MIWRLFSGYPDLRDGAGGEVKKDRYGVFQSTVPVMHLQKDTGLGTRMWPRGCPAHVRRQGRMSADNCPLVAKNRDHHHHLILCHYYCALLPLATNLATKLQSPTKREV